MLSFQLVYCPSCGSVEHVQSLLDLRIANYGQKKVNQILFLSKPKFSRREAKMLIYYKEILEHLKWNSNYFENEFSREDILSRVKSLI